MQECIAKSGRFAYLYISDVRIYIYELTKCKVISPACVRFIRCAYGVCPLNVLIRIKGPVFVILGCGKARIARTSYCT